MPEVINAPQAQSLFTIAELKKLVSFTTTSEYELLCRMFKADSDDAAQKLIRFLPRGENISDTEKIMMGKNKRAIEDANILLELKDRSLKLIEVKEKNLKKLQIDKAEPTVGQ